MLGSPPKRKVLVIDFHPAAVPAHWNRTDTLILQYIEAMKKASQAILVYEVVERLEVAEYPVLMDGRQYTDATYTEVLVDGQRALRDTNGNFMLADYKQIVQKFDILQKVESAQIDEVWMFGGPYFGFYESRMVGRGAFWCNGPAIEQDCRRFVIMGFNYERDVKEMIHDYGHRAESLLAKQFGSEAFLRKLYAEQSTLRPSNAFEQFLLDRGTVHRKPGGPEYGQDEFAWLAAMQAEWWPLTIDPNFEQTEQPVQPKPVESKYAAPKPWYQSVRGFFASLFGKK